MRQRAIFFLILICFLVTITGCANDHIITPKKPRSIEYPIMVKDQTGHMTEIKNEPKRIISLVPSTTEIAFSLKLNKNIVAVTENDDYPPEVTKLPKVGNMNINVEQVLAQKPDLVLASTLNDKKTIKKLRDLKIPVVVTEGKSVKQVYQAIDVVAQATNRTWESEQLIAKMSKEIRQTYSRVVQVPKEKRVKVWIELGPELYTVGGDDFLNEVVHLAGGINVAKSEKGWPKVSSEQVIKWKPDVIISVYNGKKEILKRKGWESIPAIQKQRVYDVDPNLVSRPSPRLTEGITQIAKMLYPEQFGEKGK